LQYLQDEAQNKYPSSNLFHEEEWDLEIVSIERVPQQNNGSDCGVFVCMFTDFMLADLPLENFSHHDMPLFRVKLSSDILRGYCVRFLH
jgi:Ulp1 family protease